MPAAPGIGSYGLGAGHDIEPADEQPHSWPITEIIGPSHRIETCLASYAPGTDLFSGAGACRHGQGTREPDYFLKILSPREIELLPLFGYGWANEKIAHYTRLSPATVRTHHQNILGKLNLHGREELMRWAIKKGFVDFRYEPGNPPPHAARALG
ncbi:MAG: response regulator transcription factor [Lacunisphaera sp.]|nr:response regulator transcription factor [Lacunisphaera sp.]